MLLQQCCESLRGLSGLHKHQNFFVMMMSSRGVWVCCCYCSAAAAYQVNRSGMGRAAGTAHAIGVEPKFDDLSCILLRLLLYQRPDR
jgi:hypothetical protein